METFDRAGAPGAGIRVLVVDDHPSNQRLMGAILESRGFVVSFAGDGPAALSTARRDDPDVILLDVMMPGMDGLEVCRELKRDVRTTGIPVIFVTALTDQRDLLAGFEAGAVDYVGKPVRAAELVARTRAHGQLHRLRGLLVVCCHCNRIRGDGGQWQTLETYVAHHSEAAFSHGLCTECLDKHYPEE